MEKANNNSSCDSRVHAYKNGKMQSVAEQEYIKLKDEYQELVNHKKL